MSIYINSLNGNYYPQQVGVIKLHKDDLPNCIIYCVADILSSQVGLTNKGFLKGIFINNITPIPDEKNAVFCTSLKEYKKHVDTLLKKASEDFNAKMDEFCSGIIYKAFKEKINTALTVETAEHKKLNIEKNQQEFFEEVLDNILSNENYKESIEELPKRISLTISNLTDTDLTLMNMSVCKLPAEDIVEAASYAREKIADAFSFELEEVFNAQEIIDHWLSTAATDEQKKLLNYTVSETDGKKKLTYYTPEVNEHYVPLEWTQNIDIMKHFIIHTDFNMKDKKEADLFAELLVKYSAKLDELQKKYATEIYMAIQSYSDLGNFHLERVVNVNGIPVPVPENDTNNYFDLTVTNTEEVWRGPAIKVKAS